MLVLLLAATIVNAATQCPHDDKAMLALSFDKFDQDLKGGWRPLSQVPGCELVAADLIATYRSARWKTFRLDQLHLNYFHEGQLRALAGDYRSAAPLIMAGVDPDSDDIDFSDYAMGTLAFLQRDRAGLELARAHLSKAVKPSWWDKASVSYGNKYTGQLTWPANLDVLDGLIACYDRPYKEAYSDACRKPFRK